MLPEHLARRTSWGDVVEWGVVAGLIGGSAMAMLLMIVSLAQGTGFAHSLYLIAATFNPAWAHATGFDLAPLLAGMLLHLFNSVLFGLIYTLLVRLAMPKPVSITVAIILGMVWSLIVLVVMTFGIVPVADPALVRGVMRDGGSFVWWIVEHLVYGAVLGAVFAESGAASLPSPMSRFGPQTAS